LKKLALAVLALAAGGALAAFWYAGRQRTPPPSVVAASGTVNAASAVPVGSPLAGEIKEIYADFNSRVKKGQVLARLDATPFELKVNLARAELEKAREQRAAPAALKQREALLRQAEGELERTYIRAPVDGTVILRNADAGQAIVGGAQGPPLFSIAQDLHEVQILAAIPEDDAARLKPGMPASFTVDAFPRRRFTGEIRQVRKSRVLIAAPNPDLALLPGMTAHVRIVADAAP
jgi:HlyD family secretion protein